LLREDWLLLSWSGMRKKQLAQQLAKESRITAGAAADQVDRVVNDILQRMRKGESAALPGLGTFHPGAGDSFQFEPGSRLHRAKKERP